MDDPISIGEIARELAPNEREREQFVRDIFLFIKWILTTGKCNETDVLTNERLPFWPAYRDAREYARRERKQVFPETRPRGAGRPTIELFGGCHGEMTSEITETADELEWLGEKALHMMYPEVAVRVNVESIMLRPPVVQRFLEGRNLEGAARLRRALGFEELVGPRPKSEHRADPASHKLPPQRQRGPKKTENAIREVGADLVAKGNFPGKTITWKEFQRKVCTALKVELGTRGYSIDTIQKAMRLTLEERRKSLIAESTKS